MKTALLAALVLSLAFLSATAVQADEKPANFAKKSSELTASLSTRADKINATFNFVRDTIAQIKTQYG
ncbi:MAG: hypothetical protein WCP55_21380 [Lentisphaerota bacterium]|jgi:uncharacterized protein YpmS